MTRSELESRLREALTRITMHDASTVPAGADLRDAIGLDSLGRLELLAEVEDIFDIFFEESGNDHANTIDSFVAIARQYVELDLEEVA